MELDILELALPKGPGPKDPSQPINVPRRCEAKVLRLYADPHGQSIFEIEHE